MSPTNRRLHLMVAISSSALGGAERVVQLLCQVIDTERFALTVVSPPSAVIERIARERGHVYLPFAFPVPIRWQAIRQLARLIRASEPDVIHTHLILADLYGMLACRIARGPVLASTIHGPNYLLLWGSFIERLRRWCLGLVYRALYRGFDGVATCSEAVRRVVSAHPGIRIDPAKLEVIHNGIDPRPFDSARDVFGRRTARPIVVCASNFAPFKGHEVLIEALRRLAPVAPVQCLLVGDGSTRATIERTVRAVGLTEAVEFLGFRDDVPTVLRQADLLVVPSHWEPFGLVVLEAMAAGVAVVATAAGGIPEIITDGVTGLLVPPANPQALAEAIRRILSDEPLRRRIIMQAHEQLRARFTAETMARAYEAWYLRLAGAPQQDRVVEGAHVR